MIFTRTSLQPFVSLTGISTQDLVAKLNSIGLEVESHIQTKAPEHVVISKILDVTPHPNADKLKVCKVDAGEQELQIVCGAGNVSAGQRVPLALVGAVVGGKHIEKTEIRGVVSEGMLCSSTELGFPKVNDGILELDATVDNMKIGTLLSNCPFFNDEVFDIGITPNRGDCLSLCGIAREIAVAFGIPLEEYIREHISEDNLLGIGRLLELRAERNLHSSLLYTVIQSDHVKLPLPIAFILAYNDMLCHNAIRNFAHYATLATGTIFTIYDIHANSSDKVDIHVHTDNFGLESVFTNNKLLSRIGVYQMPNTFPTQDKGLWVLEASYIPPEHLLSAFAHANHKSDESLISNECPKDNMLYYRTSRGSNPHLQESNKFIIYLLQQAGVTVYSGNHEFIQTPVSKTISIDIERTNHLIGNNIPVVQIVAVLRKLGFSVEVASDERFVALKVPLFRHDIHNAQDVAEEILRIFGIDNIKPVALEFKEQCSIDAHYLRYKFERLIAHNAKAQGFSETVHFVFNQRSRLERFTLPILPQEYDIQNPITEELNTLRSTLLLSLLDAMTLNIRNGKNRVNLFEIGSIFDSQRNEKRSLAFVSNGLIHEARFPSAKDTRYDIYSFAQMLANVIGRFELDSTNIKPLALFHPKQSARIIQNNQPIGTIATLHPALHNDFETDVAFLAEVDLSLLNTQPLQFKPFSRMQKSQRDLSILIKDSIMFNDIRNAIKNLHIPELINLYPLDVYKDEHMTEMHSLTIRFDIQNAERNLEEKEIKDIMQRILDELQQQFKAILR